MDILHCVCNNIPRASRWFEMQDLACLIAPRPLAIVADVQDNGFHIDGSREAAATVQKIYDKVDASNQFRFIEAQEDQPYYPELSWPVVHELFD